MEAIFLRDGFNYDAFQVSKETGLDCSVEPSLAKQSFAEECDINTIVKRFGLTGEYPQGLRAPTYGDFTGIFDFRSAMSAVVEAQQAFDEMPAEVRARFGNDPAAFVDFCSNGENRAEAEKMGLVLPKPVEEAAAAPAVAAPGGAVNGTPPASGTSA